MIDFVDDDFKRESACSAKNGRRAPGTKQAL